jgi:MipA family protein
VNFKATRAYFCYLKTMRINQVGQMKLINTAGLGAVMLAGILGGGALAADLSVKDQASGAVRGSAYIVTIGGYIIAEPEFIGSKRYGASFSPIFDVRKEGSKEWISLPNDAFSFAIFETANFRMGAAGNYVRSRDTSDDRKTLTGLREIDASYQVGGFVEYYPMPNLRTRAEVLQNFGGNEGVVANLSADLLWKPVSRGVFNIGPRLQFASDDYVSTYFSINAAESAASGLTVHNAKGGLDMVGVGAGYRYQWTKEWSTRVYAEYGRLVGDAGDSPLVKDRGSEDQLQTGVGIAYTFPFRR